MPNVTTNDNPLQFRGPPGRLQLYSVLPTVCGVDFQPDEKLSAIISDDKHIFRFRSNRSGQLKKLKIRLSANTKPGLYHASLITDDGTIPVDINVEAHQHLSISPSQLIFSGKPGGKAKLHVLFNNKGNVEIQIKKNDSLGIYDDDGIETAFASTYRMESQNLSELFANFTQKLRDGHGGLLKLRIVEGSGTLKPGHCQAVLIEAQLPSRLKPGHNYHGVWSLNTSEYAVTVKANK